LVEINIHIILQGIPVEKHHFGDIGIDGRAINYISENNKT
jgi:hypothetical protein